MIIELKYVNKILDLFYEKFAKGIFELQDLDANLLPIKTSALGLKAKRPVFLALVGARIGEYGLGCRDGKMGAGGILMRGAFWDAENTGR